MLLSRSFTRGRQPPLSKPSCDDRQEQGATEYANDGGSDWQVHLAGDKKAEHAACGSDYPPDGKSRADGIHQVRRANGGNDGVSERKQDAADVPVTGDNQSE